MTANHKPKIGLVVPGLSHGGGVPSVARFIRSVIRQSGRYDLKIVSLSMKTRDPQHASLLRPLSWARGAQAEALQWEGETAVHVGAMWGEVEFQRYRTRPALTKTLADCDVVQLVCGSPAWGNALIGMGKPVSMQVATRARVERRMRDAQRLSPKTAWRRVMTEITDRMDDRALRHMDAIQAENPWMLDYARSQTMGRNVDVRYAPPGIDANWFSPDDGCNRLHDPYILCVGRLHDPRKNVGLLLEAYARLPVRTRQGLRLVLAGASGPDDAFWARAESLGVRDRISYVMRPDRAALLRLYQQAAMLGLASDEEGLGIVILEAMACGVPVVATRCGGPDGIIDNGMDGFLVPLNDPEAMAEAINVLAQNGGLNRAMGRRARRTIEQRYAEDVTGAAFMNVWDRLIAGAAHVD